MSREKTTGTAAKKRAPRKSAAPAVEAPTSFTRFVDPEQRAALIAEAAYFRAERRGFSPGHEAADWLAAEAEVDADLLRASGSALRA